LGPLGTVATSGLLYQPQMIGEGDCGAVGGVNIGRGNRSTWRKPAPAPLCRPQIPLNQTRDRTLAAAMGTDRNLTDTQQNHSLCGTAEKENFQISANCNLHSCSLSKEEQASDVVAEPATVLFTLSLIL
jgi:hypothetical protein